VSRRRALGDGVDKIVLSRELGFIEVGRCAMGEASGELQQLGQSEPVGKNQRLCPKPGDPEGVGQFDSVDPAVVPGRANLSDGDEPAEDVAGAGATIGASAGLSESEPDILVEVIDIDGICGVY
jgi:mycofactocin precursor